jgi:hypothetical protein
VLMGRIEAVTAFEAVQRNPHLSGWALEALLHEAMAQSGQVEAEPYRQGEDITEFNGRRATHGIDLAGVHRTAGLPFVIEVKNVREWVYPQSPIVWRLLGTAAELGAVPILICRRVPEPTYLFMDEIGGYAYPTMNLMIDGAVDDAPEGEAFRAAIQTLGYRDTHFVNPKEPPKRFVSFFQERLGGRLGDMTQSFAPLSERVLEIARDEDLWTDRASRGRASGRPRKEIVREFWGAVRSREVDDLPDAADDF